MSYSHKFSMSDNITRSASNLVIPAWSPSLPPLKVTPVSQSIVSAIELTQHKPTINHIAESGALRSMTSKVVASLGLSPKVLSIVNKGINSIIPAIHEDAKIADKVTAITGAANPLSPYEVKERELKLDLKKISNSRLVTFLLQFIYQSDFFKSEVLNRYEMILVAVTLMKHESQFDPSIRYIDEPGNPKSASAYGLFQHRKINWIDGVRRFRALPEATQLKINKSIEQAFGKYYPINVVEASHSTSNPELQVIPAIMHLQSLFLGLDKQFKFDPIRSTWTIRTSPPTSFIKRIFKEYSPLLHNRLYGAITLCSLMAAEGVNITKDLAKGRERQIHYPKRPWTDCGYVKSLTGTGGGDVLAQVASREDVVARTFGRELTASGDIISSPRIMLLQDYLVSDTHPQLTAQGIVLDAPITTILTLFVPEATVLFTDDDTKYGQGRRIVMKLSDGSKMTIGLLQTVMVKNGDHLQEGYPLGVVSGPFFLKFSKADGTIVHPLTRITLDAIALSANQDIVY